MFKKLGLAFLVICFFMAGCMKDVKQKNELVSANGKSVSKEYNNIVPSKEKNNTKEQINATSEDKNVDDYIKFFAPDHNLSYWLIEEKKMNINNLELIVNEIIKDEKNKIPKNTKLLNISVKNGIAFVDLSKDFESFEIGDVCLSLNIYCIVNVLCLNEQLHITGVRFLQDGSEIKSIGGVDTVDILTANTKLLKI